MIILSLIINSKEETNEFKELRDSLDKKCILIEKDTINENILNIISEKNNSEIKKYVHSCVSTYLYRLLIHEYLNKNIKDFLRKKYLFLTEGEIYEIEKLIKNVLFNENKPSYEIDISDNVKLILDIIDNTIDENNQINVKGFLIFRTKSAFAIIEKIIDKFIEVYLSIKEYEEYLQLLKYFVDTQTCKISKIIIKNINDNYIVIDEYGNDLYENFLISIDNPEETNINTEDLIISGLISNAPKDIEIHDKENFKNKEFIKIIEKVFENKVTYLINTVSE